MASYEKQLALARESEEEEEDEIIGIIETIKEKILTPIRLFLSPTARRAYLRTLLFFLAALFLFFVAAAAYILFYATYVPVRGFSHPVHLQFDPARAQQPYGVVQLRDGQIIHGQRYDVHVLLDLPRTRSNRDAGNFMLDLRLLAPGAGAVTGAVLEAVLGDAAAAEVLTRSRRPAILTYRSVVMEAVHKASMLPWYVFGWRREAEMVSVGMMEGVEFSRGRRNVPASARLELSSDAKMQVYSVRLVFTAKLSGLRYLMYNFRVISFIVFTMLFWTAELGSALTVWLVLSYLVSRPEADDQKLGKIEKSPKSEEEQGKDDVAVKSEDEGDEGDMSDTERSFPTYSRQPPLRYTSPVVKKEEETTTTPLSEIPVAGADADDEDEDADFVLDDGARGPPGLHSDSGIGTSMDSSATRRDSVRRRKSGGLGGGSQGREE